METRGRKKNFYATQCILVWRTEQLIPLSHPCIRVRHPHRLYRRVHAHDVWLPRKAGRVRLVFLLASINGPVALHDRSLQFLLLGQPANGSSNRYVCHRRHRYNQGNLQSIGSYYKAEQNSNSRRLLARLRPHNRDLCNAGTSMPSHRLHLPPITFDSDTQLTMFCFITLSA